MAEIPEDAEVVQDLDESFSEGWGVDTGHAPGFRRGETDMKVDAVWTGDFLA